MRLTPELDVEWVVQASRLNIVKSDIEVDSQGRIVLVCQASIDPGQIVRLNADGSLDTAVVARNSLFRIPLCCLTMV
ncbi:MAG: hypothetical protein R3E66_05630 [bacterium]